MLIGDLFERDVTRTIPPVVYFHEQEPEALKREVEEYIITGGYPPGDPRATEGGIHEQFVRLLSGIHRVLSGNTQVEPACWISGFYGSGKSSFAKLLGLALDDRKLPDGRSLADALLAQNHSPNAAELRQLWQDLVGGIKPMAAVFDVGSKARDNEHIHAVVVRQVQERLGYSQQSSLVAEYELKLELEGRYDAFIVKVPEVHQGKRWTELKDKPLVEDYFSAVLHALQPELYTDPMSWVDSRSGSRFEGKRSADEAVQAIEQMLAQRAPGCTLFIVVDEVSQYVHESDDRMLALQSFVMAIKQRTKGRIWLLATGQQKLEEGTGVASAVVKLKDRFPPALRVHLGVANIRDVVHKRLLRKSKLQEGDLKALFQKHRSELALYTYKGEELTELDFVEVYPMLPGHIPLLLDITTGLRSRSTRTQGDSHAIRGLLQLLGDLFRDRDLARYEVGHLVTLDMIYDVLGSALSPDVQLTISRAFDFCNRHQNKLMARVVKAVAMLELVQEHQKTSTELIARCLYTRLGQENPQAEIQQALDLLMGESLLGYSEKTGYKIESSAGQQWQRERDGYAPGVEQRSEKVAQTLGLLLGDVPKPSLEGLDIPWLALFSDGVGAKELRIKDERKYTVVTVDFQLTKSEAADQWIPRSDSQTYRDRILWVAHEDGVRHAADKLVRSERILERYSNRPNLDPELQRLLIEERNRHDNVRRELSEAVKAAFMAGNLYFRARQTAAKDVGTSFTTALSAFGNRVVRDLYPHPATFSVSEKEILYLIDNQELTAPPPVLGQERLGILSLDAGRYEVTCNGQVPSDVLAYIKEQGSVTGSTLLAHFGAPPHGVPPDVLRATVVGLLRGGKIRVELPGTPELTSVRDEGTRELLKESGVRKAKLSLNTTETLDARDRNAICLLFREALGKEVARDNDAIADAVAEKFVAVRERITALAERFRRLPNDVVYPETLTKLERALETSRRDRRVEPTVLAVKRALPVLRDGLGLLRRMETDLTDQAIDTLREAEEVLRFRWPSLQALGAPDDVQAAAQAIDAHLATERAWEDTTELAPAIERVRAAYRARRRELLMAHEAHVEQAIDAIKRRDGFEKLNPDQRHQVLRHLHEGAAAHTTEDAVAPALEALGSQLEARLAAAQAKASAELDALLEGLGRPPTVDVALEMSGAEIEDEAGLERLLDRLRQRILHELKAKHRVRLK